MRHRRPRLLLFIVLLTAGGWWGQVIDALAHISERAGAHTSRPHFENPSAQTHSDRCVLARPGLTTQNAEQYGCAGIFAGPTQSHAHPSVAQVAGFPVTGVPHSRSPPVS